MQVTLKVNSCQVVSTEGENGLTLSKNREDL